MARSSGGSRGGACGQDDPIKHVIVLMLENRSFDQMLGAVQKVHLDLDGAETAGPPARSSGSWGTRRRSPRRSAPASAGRDGRTAKRSLLRRSTTPRRGAGGRRARRF